MHSDTIHYICRRRRIILSSCAMSKPRNFCLQLRTSTSFVRLWNFVRIIFSMIELGTLFNINFSAESLSTNTPSWPFITDLYKRGSWPFSLFFDPNFALLRPGICSRLIGLPCKLPTNTVLKSTHCVLPLLRKSLARRKCLLLLFQYE